MALDDRRGWRRARETETEMESVDESAGTRRRLRGYNWKKRAMCTRDSLILLEEIEFRIRRVSDHTKI